MAAGDAYVVVPTSTATTAFLALQPGSGVEVSVHNIFYSVAVEVYWYDGTNSILLANDPTPGSMSGVWECTNSVYLRVKNVAAGTGYLGASGRVTK